MLGLPLRGGFEMGLTIEQVEKLKVGDYVKRLCDGTSHIRLTAGKIYRIKRIDSPGIPVVTGDDGGDEYVFKANIDRWELAKNPDLAMSPLFPSDYPEVTSVFVSPGIQPENNLKLVLQ